MDQRRSGRKRSEAWFRDLHRIVPLGLVAMAVAFNLAALRADTNPGSTANDTPQHLAMIEWAEDRIEAGHLPLDGWYPNLGLGSPHFRHYQSFPHIIAGYASTIFGVYTTYNWSLYLLLALWPICVYWSGRLFGASRWICAAAAVVSPLIAGVKTDAVGFEYAAYIRAGFGVWAQLWGMWLLPLTLALAWRAVNRKGSYVWAAIALALLMASHFLTAYLALLTIGLWVLLARRDLWQRVGRTAVVVVGGFLVGGWAVGPVVLDATWASRQEFLLNTHYTDSYGALTVFQWLISGEILDAGRRPLITLFAGIGLGVCIARFSDLRARALLAFGGLSLALYMGRGVVGPVLDRLPIGGDILLHRYSTGVQLAGIFLAAVGAVWLGGAAVNAVLWIVARVSKESTPGWASRGELTVSVVIIGLFLLVPAVRERWSFATAGASAIEVQRNADRTEGLDVIALIEDAKARGDGRVYAGVSEFSGESNLVGGAPVYKMLATYEADAVGYTYRTLSLASNLERLFDESNPAHFDLFGIRYVLRPQGLPLEIPNKQLAQRGRHRLLEVKTSGYLAVIDTAGTIEADRSNIAARMTAFLSSDELREGVYPTVAYAGREAAPPTVKGKVPKGEPGRVLRQSAAPMEGVFAGEVTVKRRSVVLLKSSFDPRWRVTVDDVRVEPQMIAPAFVGVPVPPGRHSVRFEYESLPWYGPLLALSALAIAALALVPRLTRRRRAGQAARPSPQTDDS